VTANLTKTGKLTGKLEYMGLTHPFKAQLDLSLHAQTSVTRRKDSPVALVLDLSSATGELAIRSDGTRNRRERERRCAAHSETREGCPSRAGRTLHDAAEAGADSPTDMTASGFLALNIACVWNDFLGRQIARHVAGERKRFCYRQRTMLHSTRRCM
jgi:hypothetical protein